MKLSITMLEVLEQLQRGNTTAFGYTSDTLGATYINANTVKALIRRGLLEPCGERGWNTYMFEGEERGHRVTLYKISKAGQEALLDVGKEIEIPVEPFRIDPALVQKALDIQTQDRLNEWKQQQAH